MLDPLRDWLIRILRVPPSPILATDPRDTRVFRAGRGYYHYKLLIWAAGQIAVFLALLFGFFALSRIPPVTDPGPLATGFAWLRRLAWATYLLQLPASFALLKLDFDMRWYILSEGSLRIREGILSLREKTMTFANIQNISVRQNPVQRIFGISDVQVRSAGGGAIEGQAQGAHVGESMHEAWFRGVDDAELVSTTVRDRVRRHGGAGLGDPEDDDRRTSDLREAAAAARELHREAAELRNSLRQLRGAAEQPKPALPEPH